MNATSQDVANRKTLLGFTEADASRLARCKPFVEAEIEALVAEFYTEQMSHPAVAARISDPDMLARLHGTMRQYVRDLFGGEYDVDYADTRTRIGRSHQRLAISPMLYLAGVGTLTSVIGRRLSAMCKAGKIESEYQDVQSSLNKLMLFDAQLIFEAYFDHLVQEIEASKRDVEAYTLSLQEKNKQLAEISRHDMLTDLYNHRAFYEHLRRIASNARRQRFPLSLAYMDLNDFKAVNDREGHDAGDRILALVGHVINTTIREGDVGCRYGGDEFALILPDTTLAGAEILCARLIGAFERGANEGVSFSVGIAQMGPDDFTDIETFVKTADQLMYQAKAEAKQGKGYQVKAAPAAGRDPLIAPSRSVGS
ncbi:MAG: GGDEF domain-containing protein [Alphaproteobacteria bacterium]|jgi:diguanylate cyclase (GGDEF)-like protein|nr:GGDEF domain-containing protein [Alphaproteobacteria bacterium]MDP6516011.1 GGDEF domain-containing protein [Alphaproteobacteria bacterium]|tara:strand:- start:239 stop:1342 length:1104 start_codon:yes stop_codon:yes gene_type:complete